MGALYEYQDKQGRSAALIADAVWNFVDSNKAELDGAIDYSRDGEYDYFGFKTLEKSYLLRRVLSGEFVQVNRHLLRDLVEKNFWTEDMRMQLIAHNGSVQHLDLPADFKELYKTVWEIKQRIVLDMAADRGAYIDQSQSLNIHMIDATT